MRDLCSCCLLNTSEPPSPPPSSPPPPPTLTPAPPASRKENGEQPQSILAFSKIFFSNFKIHGTGRVKTAICHQHLRLSLENAEF